MPLNQTLRLYALNIFEFMQDTNDIRNLWIYATISTFTFVSTEHSNDKWMLRQNWQAMQMSLSIFSAMTSYFVEITTSNNS